MKSVTTMWRLGPAGAQVRNDSGVCMATARENHRETVLEAPHQVQRVGRVIKEADIERQSARNRKRGGDSNGGVQRRFLGSLNGLGVFGESPG